jgi:GNAT superfamily N-acetyltransferase
MTLTIQPLTPARLTDLANLFMQGGDPRWCWCAYYRVRGPFFSGATAAGHRAVLEAAVEDGVAVGRAPGLIAYEGDDAVGWVSVGPRSDYQRLAHSKVLAPVDDTPVWSIVCFVVGRRFRGRGIAHALLDAAIDFARHHGATTIEEPASTMARCSRARSRCSRRPGSGRWPGASGTPRPRSDRSSDCRSTRIPREQHRLRFAAPDSPGESRAIASPGHGLRHPSRSRHRRPSGLTPVSRRG